MRCLAVLGALVFLALTSFARAQLQVTAQTERTNFLLYERVDILVTIQNLGETDLILDNNEGHPWLSFLVIKHSGLPVRSERESDFAALNLKVGETKTLRVNITPLFSFREEGEFKVTAVVDLPGQGDMLSEPVPFVVMRGTKVWSQVRPVDESQRLYSLLRFSPDANSTKLYLRVEDPSENLVYANLALGDMASYMDPEVNFDPQGNLHVLQPVALSTYLYTRTDRDGKVLNQTIFKTFREVAPRLAKTEDGNVIVAGGQAVDPNAPRERLSETQHPLKTLPPGPAMAQPIVQPVSGAHP